MLTELKNFKKPLSLFKQKAILNVKKDGNAFLIEKLNNGSMIIPLENEESGEEYSLSFESSEALKLLKKFRSSKKKLKVGYEKEKSKLFIKYDEDDGEEVFLDVEEYKVNLNNSLKPLASFGINDIELLISFLKKGKRGKNIEFIRDSGSLNIIVKDNGAFLCHLSLNNFEQLVVKDVDTKIETKVSIKCSELDLLNELLKNSLVQSVNVNIFKNYVQFKSDKFTLNILVENKVPAISEKIEVSGVEFENIQDEDTRVKKFKEGLDVSEEQAEVVKRYNNALYHVLPPLNLYVDEEKVLIEKKSETLEYLKVETNRYY